MSSLRTFRPLPLEIVALSLLAVAGLYLLVFSVTLYLPNGDSASFAINHYVIAAALALLVGLLTGRKKNSPAEALGRKAFAAVRNILAFALIVYLHFNFKLWAQLINPRLFDDWYQWTDQLLTPVISAIIFINIGFEPLRQIMPHAYHDIFVYMFFATFIIFSLHPRAHRHSAELTTAIALILGIGGMTYALAPAWGPFVFGPSPDEIAGQIQSDMGNFYRSFVESKGQAYSGQHFVAAVAAMPSLHSAHAFALWVYARRHIPWLGYVYLVALIFILSEAIASKWHYLIDLLFGLLIAAFCMRLASSLHRTQSIYEPEQQAAPTP